MFMKNIDVLTMINYFIGSFSCCFSLFISGKILLNKKILKSNVVDYLLLVIFSVFLIFNSLIIDNVLKILGTLLVFFSVFKFILKSTIHDSFVYSVITCLIFLLGEVTFALFISLFDLIFNTEISKVVIKSFFGNLFISLISSCYIILLKNVIRKYVAKLKNNNKFYFAFVVFITILIVLSSVYKLSSNSWQFNYSFVLNMIIILGCSCLLIILLKQHFDNKEIADKYILLEDYLKTSASIIEKYSSTIHKYKNNLITIRGYINSDKEKSITYVDSLLENYKEKKYSWVSKINYLEIDTLRYLIYYKLSKAEDNNLKLVITVSNDLKNIKYKELPVNQIGILADIIGEYLDNAIYAATESNEKMLILDLYIQDNIINFVLSNTYKNKFDINSITKSGYTTKGKGHGLGLYDIDKQIKKLPYVEKSYEVMEEYFIVNIKLDIIDNDIKKEKAKKKVD